MESRYTVNCDVVETWLSGVRLKALDVGRNGSVASVAQPARVNREQGIESPALKCPPILMTALSLPSLSWASAQNVGRRQKHNG